MGQKKRQLSITLLLLMAVLGLNAQVQQLDTISLKADLDAMQNDSIIQELRNMLDSSRQTESFFSVNLSASNSLFSAKNSAFNAQQSNSGVTAFLPSVSYFHKSGFGLSTTGYVRTIDASPSLYQLAFSPSYDHIGKSLLCGVSYTYYSKKKELSTSVTPYDNELYAYIQGRKMWFRPSLALGWAEGKYQDISTIPIRVGGNNFWIVDTSNVLLNDLSLVASVSHSFSFNDVFSNNDMFSIVPQLSLIGGMQNYSTESRSSVVGTRTREAELERVRKLYNVSKTAVSKFSLQTAAFSTNISWYKSAFSISAGYFLGYYLDKTLVNKISQIFNINMGLTF